LAPSYTGQEVGVAVAIQARIGQKEKLWTTSTVKKILQTWVREINTSKIHVFFVLTNLAEMFPRGGAMDDQRNKDPGFPDLGFRYKVLIQTYS